jgi:hypothetical protein
MECGSFCNRARPVCLNREKITAYLSQMTMVGLLRSSFAMDIEIRHAIDAVRKDVRQVDGRLSAEIRQVEARLRQEIREEGIATRRHLDMVAESLHDAIRIIAEGLVTLDTKVEAMRSDHPSSIVHRQTSSS